MFSAGDVRSILATLKQREFPANDDDFHLSRDGDHVIAVKTARRQLEDAVDLQGSVAIEDLPRVLDLQDVTSVVKWADEQEHLATPGNRRLSLPPWIQKVIAIHAFDRMDRRIIEVEELSSFWGLSRQVIEEIITAFQGSFSKPHLLPGDYLCSRRLHERQKRLLAAITQGAMKRGDSVNVSAALAQPPLAIVHHLLRQHIEGDNLDDCEVQEKSDGVYFVPLRAMKARAEQEEVRLIASYQQRLSDQGFCMIDEKVPSNRNIAPKLLQTKIPGLKPNQAQVLTRDSQASTQIWRDDTTIIMMRDLLTATQAELVARAPVAAKLVYIRTADVDAALSLESETVNLFARDAAPTDPDPRALVMYSTDRGAIENAFSDELHRLGREATQTFVLQVRERLILPSQLYTAGVNIATEPTLKQRLDEFVLSHIKEDILPSASKLVAALDLRPPKTVRAEWDRLQTSLKSSLSLNAAEMALERFGRKVKVARAKPEGETREQQLLAARDSSLSAKLAAIKRVKRPSDVLQQVTWFLLACVAATPALFVSSGRDASRVIKLFFELAAVRAEEDDKGDADDLASGSTRMDWVAAGRRLEGFRDDIKAGRQTDADVDAVRELAARAFEARVVRSMDST